VLLTSKEKPVKKLVFGHIVTRLLLAASIGQATAPEAPLQRPQLGKC
jgi:hypothetical protein